MILETRSFYIPSRPSAGCSLILAVIILVMGLKNYWMVRRSKLIEILNTARQEQSLPRIRWVRGLLVWPVSLQLIIWP